MELKQLLNMILVQVVTLAATADDGVIDSSKAVMEQI